ncbi:hypothetical protein TcWFU_003924 [Taenia crassiceps]|uniref:Uncharacterized protein n=1 Tax=Taenia crassiceps TaxID=6207 RepID=A0ABR4Q503_9CEST
MLNIVTKSVQSPPSVEPSLVTINSDTLELQLLPSILLKVLATHSPYLHLRIASPNFYSCHFLFHHLLPSPHLISAALISSRPMSSYSMPSHLSLLYERNLELYFVQTNHYATVQQEDALSSYQLLAGHRIAAMRVAVQSTRVR